MIGAAWAIAALAVVPVARTLRGDFNADRSQERATGSLRPLEGAPGRSPLRLDSSTALVLVYSPTCSACVANTDNWVRLGGELRASHPDVPIVVVAAPKDPLGHPKLPPALRSAFAEYRFDSSGVESAFGVNMLPATVALRDGHIVSVVYGVVGPRRRARVVRAFDGAAL